MNPNVTIVRIEPLATNRFNQRPVKALRVRIKDAEDAAGIFSAMTAAINAADDILTNINMGKLFYTWLHARGHCPIATLAPTAGSQEVGYRFFDAYRLNVLRDLQTEWWKMWVSEYFDQIAQSGICETIFNFEDNSPAQRVFCNTQLEACDITANQDSLTLSIRDGLWSEVARLEWFEDNGWFAIHLTLAAPSEKAIKPFYAAFERLSTMVEHTCSFVHDGTLVITPPMLSSVELFSTPYVSVERAGVTAYTTGLHEFHGESTQWSDDDHEGVRNPFGYIDPASIILSPETAEIIQVCDSRHAKGLEKALERYRSVAAIMGPDFI